MFIYTCMYKKYPFTVDNCIESELHTSERAYKKNKDFSKDNPTSGGTDFQPASWKPNS